MNVLSKNQNKPHSKLECVPSAVKWPINSVLASILKVLQRKTAVVLSGQKMLLH